MLVGQEPWGQRRTTKERLVVEPFKLVVVRVGGNTEG